MVRAPALHAGGRRFESSTAHQTTLYAALRREVSPIEPAIALGTTLPEFARILRAGGVLRLMFKYGSRVATVYDRESTTGTTALK